MNRRTVDQQNSGTVEHRITSFHVDLVRKKPEKDEVFTISGEEVDTSFGTMESKHNLNERLINFSAAVIKISKRFPKIAAATNIAGQVARSASAPALHYGEAQASESPKDFIHKMKGALKELRETYNGLRIARQMCWLPEEDFTWVIDENNQLISIFFTSVRTAERNMNNESDKENKKKNSEDNDSKNATDKSANPEA